VLLNACRSPTPSNPRKQWIRTKQNKNIFITYHLSHFFILFFQKIFSFVFFVFICFWGEKKVFSIYFYKIFI